MWKPRASVTMYTLNERARMVDMVLTHTQTTENVWWSPRWEDKAGGRHGGFNSYVIAKAGPDPALLEPGEILLCSINGQGEVRWYVRERDVRYMLRSEASALGLGGACAAMGDWYEQLAAARYFGLIPERKE